MFLEFVDTPVGAGGGALTTFPGPDACFRSRPSSSPDDPECVGADIVIAAAPQTVPKPATLAIFGVGLSALGLMRRRLRKGA